MSNGEPLRFEMDRLLAYNDEAILAEIQRVANLIPSTRISRKAFDGLSRVSSSTVARRFGGWFEALQAAGLSDRYSGRSVSPKMRDQRSKVLTAEDIKQELRRIAGVVDRSTLTRSDILAHSEVMGERVILNRFGTWKAALEAAGLELTPRGRRWTDEDYFENLLQVWTHYGRAPRFAEMRFPPSRITPKGYASKFGTWGRAKQAFVDRVNSDLSAFDRSTPAPQSTIPEPTNSAFHPEDRAYVPLGLRYKVLRRDRFRCVTCGRSPATDLVCVLHVDHILAFARGGKTREDNLRTLCDECNLGKSDGWA